MAHFFHICAKKIFNICHKEKNICHKFFSCLLQKFGNFMEQKKFFFWHIQKFLWLWLPLPFINCQWIVKIATCLLEYYLHGSKFFCTLNFAWKGFWFCFKKFVYLNYKKNRLNLGTIEANCLETDTSEPVAVVSLSAESNRSFII